MIDGRNNIQSNHKSEKNTDSKDKAEEKPLLLGRLKEKKELLVNIAKKDAPAQEKNPEYDMQ